MSEQTTTLRGVVVGTRYRTDKFAVITFRVIGNNGKLADQIAVKGFGKSVPSTSKEDVVELIGNWENDPKFGRQFKVVDYFHVVPTTPKELEAYLGKYMKGTGVGPAKAKAIIEHFGMDTMRIIGEEPYKLTEVSGITEKTVERIRNFWSDEHLNRPAEMWLAHNGVSRAFAKLIIARFGSKTIEIMQENPYRATNVPRIGFKLADSIAMKMGWPKTSPERTEAAVCYVLSEAKDRGHVFLHRGELLEELQKIANVSEADAQTALDNVVARNEIVRDKADSGQGFSLEVYYDPYLYAAEKELASRVGELLSYAHQIPRDLNTAINEVQGRLHIPLSPEQSDGIRAAFEHHVSIVTGGPGTGKSTLVRGLIQTCEYLGIDYVLGAPTGRAAKRLSEVTDREAKTIHRLLEFDAQAYVFLRNRTVPLTAQMVIIDEGSMLDIQLARSLFEAIPDNASLVIIGDVDQLPAVGAGMVLKDLINCGVIKVTRLNNIFRQAEGSRIITNAHRIRKGQMPQFPEVKGLQSDSYLVKIPMTYDHDKEKRVDNVAWAKEMLVKMCRDFIPKKIAGIDPIKDIQVLIPMKVGDLGTRELNKILQDALNPQQIQTGYRGDGESYEVIGDEYHVRGGVFRKNDRVMQFRNNYTLDIYNGDIGFVLGYDSEDQVLLIDFYGRLVKYPEDTTNNLQLAYAQTIHKSQGSEYPVVVVLLSSAHYVMLERNLIYTANTRAKKLCVFVASEWALQKAVDNAQVQARNSFLAARVRGAAQLEVV